MSSKARMVTLARKQMRADKYVREALIVRAIVEHRDIQSKVAIATLRDATKVGR